MISQTFVCKLQSPGETSADWWQARCDTGVLSRVALRLAHLKSSSANTERIFSIMKLIQTPIKTNFSIEVLTNIARSKISMSNQDDRALFDIISDPTRAEEDDVSPITTPRRVSRIKRITQSFRGLRTRILGVHQAEDQTQSQSSNSQIRDHRSQIEKLANATIRENYDKFFKLIDFSIINEFKEQELRNSPEEEDLENMFRRFRESRNKNNIID